MCAILGWHAMIGRLGARLVIQHRRRSTSTRPYSNVVGRAIGEGMQMAVSANFPLAKGSCSANVSDCYPVQGHTYCASGRMPFSIPPLRRRDCWWHTEVSQKVCLFAG